MKEFMAVRKPIYIAEVSANYESFSFTGDMFNAFIEQHPEYKDCKSVMVGQSDYSESAR